MHHYLMALVILMAGMLTVTTVGVVPAVAVSPDRCLDCHGNTSIVGKGKAYLYINPQRFANASHAPIGCSSCHDSVSSGHPADGTRPSRATCKECHAPVVREYLTGIHAEKATCPDCHNPHNARSAAVVSGMDMNNTCARCHESAKTIKSHSQWLPQAELHITALPCITCHTGSENYVIDLFIESHHKDRPHQDFAPAGYGELLMLVPQGMNVTALIDSNGDKFISLNELRSFYHGSRSKGLRLWGMMMPEKITHTYQILKNRWDCTFCHASGSNALQTSHVVFPDKDGQYVKIPVEKGAILDLLYGTPDFYMMGTSRSPILSFIGIAIVACGAMVPLFHGTLRFLTRKNRKGGHHGAS